MSQPRDAERGVAADGGRGRLVLVPTPIGNLEDMTLRGLRALREADLIACEDTRHSRRLLEHFQIQRPTVSFHQHNEAARTAELLERLLAGQVIALISDAGTPGISDPGERLVRAAVARGVAVEALPGASALLPALIASGLPAAPFSFAGFLPARSGERRGALDAWGRRAETVIFYEAPHRLQATLADLVEMLGPDRQLVVARELTKLHEEFRRGSAAEVAAHFAADPPLGECVLLLAPYRGEALPTAATELADRIRTLLQAPGADERHVLRQVARERGLDRSEVFRRWQAAQRCDRNGR